MSKQLIIEQPCMLHIKQFTNDDYLTFFSLIFIFFAVCIHENLIQEVKLRGKIMLN